MFSYLKKNNLIIDLKENIKVKNMVLHNKYIYMFYMFCLLLLQIINLMKSIDKNFSIFIASRQFL